MFNVLQYPVLCAAVYETFNMLVMCFIALNLHRKENDLSEELCLLCDKDDLATVGIEELRCCFRLRRK